MTARTISRQAYHDHIASGKALRQWQQVYAAIEANPGQTRAEIARDTGIRLNCVCGRVRELLAPECGMIAEGSRRKCTVTGEQAHILTLPREFRGGSSVGYSPAQIKLWEDENQFPHYPSLARYVLRMPREDQEAFYRRWRARHGEESAEKLAAAIRAEQERMRAAA